MKFTETAMHPREGIDAMRAFRNAQLANVRKVAPGLQSLHLRGPEMNPFIPQPAWRTFDGMVILACVEDKPDGFPWLHVSFSRKDRCPDYADMLLIRRLFFPPDATVLHVFPPESEHDNTHSTCLHLWARLNGESPLPDLRIHGLGQSGV